MTPALRFRPSFLRLARAGSLGVWLAWATGCSPKIGDDCTTAVDCSALGDRLCDVTQPGGYCTQFGCQPDGCPSEAACIVFRSGLDPACGDATAGKGGRFAQTFCMRTCEGSSDCRDGYVCASPAERGAALLDQKREDAASLRVCVAVATFVAPPAEAPGICSPGTAPPLVPTTASGGASSTTTASGAVTSSSAVSGGQGGDGGPGAGGQGGAGR